MLRIRTANLGGRFSPGGAFGGRGHGLDSSRSHSFQSAWRLEDYADSRCALVAFRRRFLRRLLPSFDISISFWPAAALRGFLGALAAFAGAACLPTGAAQRLDQVDDVGRCRRSVGVIGLPAHFWLMRSISAVSYRLEAVKSEWSNSYLRQMSLKPF